MLRLCWRLVQDILHVRGFCHSTLCPALHGLCVAAQQCHPQLLPSSRTDRWASLEAPTQSMAEAPRESSLQLCQGFTGPCRLPARVWAGAVLWWKHPTLFGSRLTSQGTEKAFRCFCLQEVGWSCTQHGLSSSRNHLCSAAVNGGESGKKALLGWRAPCNDRAWFCCLLFDCFLAFFLVPFFLLILPFPKMKYPVYNCSQIVIIICGQMAHSLWSSNCRKEIDSSPWLCLEIWELQCCCFSWPSMGCNMSCSVILWVICARRKKGSPWLYLIWMSPGVGWCCPEPPQGTRGCREGLCLWCQAPHHALHLLAALCVLHATAPSKVQFSFTWNAHEILQPADPVVLVAFLGTAVGK